MRRNESNTALQCTYAFAVHNSSWNSSPRIQLLSGEDAFPPLLLSTTVVVAMYDLWATTTHRLRTFLVADAAARRVAARALHGTPSRIRSSKTGGMFSCVLSAAALCVMNTVLHCILSQLQAHFFTGFDQVLWGLLLLLLAATQVRKSSIRGAVTLHY